MSQFNYPAAAGAAGIQLAAAASQAATFNGSWVDVRQYEGPMLIVQNKGAGTGSLAGKIQHASDGAGTGAADLPGAAFTLVTTAAGQQMLAIRPSETLGWIRYVGTIVTGPQLVAVSAAGVLKVV